MDVSVDIVNDTKIRKLYRHAPEHAGAGVVAYIATMGESWKAGHRVTVEDAWPAYLPFDQVAVDAMIHVALLDSKGLVSAKAWRSWFTPAQTRREAVRERWRRANEKRAHSSTNDNAASTDDSAQSPRGSSADTAANHSVPFRSVDSDPLETREIPPPPTSGGRRSNGTNPRVTGTSPRKRAANPRATKTSIRDVRADQKRGPTKLAESLREAIARQTPIDDELPPFLRGEPAPAAKP